MMLPGADERLYPVTKIAAVVRSLSEEGIAPARALRGLALSDDDLVSPETRISLNQVLRCYRNALRLSDDPHFPYRTGLGLHVSTYGMYGFAILSSTSFRQTISFAEKYHQLATPLAHIAFREEGDRCAWTVAPVPRPDVDADLYRFIVELQFGVTASLHRDVMGAGFRPKQLSVAYPSLEDRQGLANLAGCDVAFCQGENRFVFDTSWLDGAPELGNEVAYRSVVSLCDGLMEELHLRAGAAGKVREIVLVNMTRPVSLDAVAAQLKTTTRTLRRNLQAEGTSFRKIVDELRMQVAIKYLRDTNLTVEETASSLGFSDAANFRQAFRRGTDSAPARFRHLARS